MRHNVFLKKIKNFLSEKRLLHTFRVLKVSLFLAKKYGVNQKKIFISAILHDIGKDIQISKQRKIIKKLKDKKLLQIPSIWHCFTGEVIAKKIFKIKDKQILNAIKYHSTGNLKMGNIGKIIFVADFIEPGRKYLSSVFIRKKMNTSIELDKLVLLVLEKKLVYLINEKKIIHKNSIDFWNKAVLNL